MTRPTKAGSKDIGNERPVKKRKTTRKHTAATPRRHTRSMTTDAPRKVVFDTTELLEHIISFVSLKDILAKVQRLSRQWKKVVDSSTAIQNKIRKGPNATAIQPTYFTNEQITLAYPLWGKLEIPVYSCAMAFNPVLLEGSVGSLRFYLDQDIEPRLLKKSNGDNVNARLADLTCHRASGGPDRPTRRLCSSWRNMYLTDPPITTAVLRVSNLYDTREGYGPKIIKLSVQDRDGLTLGLLHDTLNAAVPPGMPQRWASRARYLVGSVSAAFE